MGQKVQMDEFEGGVWPSVLYSLAEPLCNTRPRQGRLVPVHCVKTEAWLSSAAVDFPDIPSYWLDLNEHELLFTTSSFSFIYGYFVDQYYQGVLL